MSGPVFEALVREVKTHPVLGSRLSEFVVVGGGAVAAHVLKRDVHDFDLVLLPAFWNDCAKIYETGSKSIGRSMNMQITDTIQAFDFVEAGRCKMSAVDVHRRSEVIDGVPFQSLVDVLAAKREMWRPSDVRDVALLEPVLWQRFVEVSL